MKTLRFISAGLFVVLLSFTITACGDDEEEDEILNDPPTENPTPDSEPNTSKKLVRIERISCDGDTLTYSFDYDNSNKVSLVTIYSNDGFWERFPIEYSDSTISCKGEYGGKDIFNLSARKIVNAFVGEDGFTTEQIFNYNSDGHLVHYEVISKRWTPQKMLSWTGDRMMTKLDYLSSSSTDPFGSNWYFYNTGQTCKGFNPMIVFEFMGCGEQYVFVYAQPELVGLKSNYLISSWESNDDGREYNYSFYENGYLKSCAIEEVEGVINCTYTFVWE